MDYPQIGRCVMCGLPAEIDYDHEDGNGAHYTIRCRPCKKAVSEQPYCHTPECSSQVCGTMTHIANPRSVGRGAKAVYECKRCGLKGTAVHFAVLSSYQSGLRDAQRAAQGGLDLTMVRAETARASAGYDHRISRAHGRAYLLGLRHAGITA